MTKDLFEFEKCYYMNYFKIIPNLSGSTCPRNLRKAEPSRQTAQEPVPENQEVCAGQVQPHERDFLDRVDLRQNQGQKAQKEFDQK